MYGPRHSYDSAYLAEVDRQTREEDFIRRLLRALEDERVKAKIEAVFGRIPDGGAEKSEGGA